MCSIVSSVWAQLLLKPNFVTGALRKILGFSKKKKGGEREMLAADMKKHLTHQWPLHQQGAAGRVAAIACRCYCVPVRWEQFRRTVTEVINYFMIACNPVVFYTCSSFFICIIKLSDKLSLNAGNFTSASIQYFVFYFKKEGKSLFVQFPASQLFNSRLFFFFLLFNSFSFIC